MVKAFSKSLKGSWRKAPTRDLASNQAPNNPDKPGEKTERTSSKETCYSGMVEMWEDGPVIAWGDFTGARVYPSVDKLDEFVRLAERESQVSSVLALPESKKFLLGCKSGSLLAFLVTKEAGTGCNKYDPVATSTLEKGEEVCGLGCVSVSPLRVASAREDGTVNLHTGMLLDESEQLFRSTGRLLTMKTFDFHGPKVMTGDSTGHIRVWSRGLKKERWIQVDSFQLPEERQPVHIEVLKGAKHSATVLVGDNVDSVSVIQLDSNANLHLEDIPTVNVGGPVSLLSVVDNVFLVAGNDKSQIQAWALNEEGTPPTLEKTIECVDDADEQRRVGPIVAAIPSQKYGTIHCLRQDGYLFKWNVVDDDAPKPNERVASPNRMYVPPATKQQLPKKRRYTPSQSNEQETLWTNETWEELPDFDALANLMEYGAARDCDRMRMHIVRLSFLHYWEIEKTGALEGIDLIFNLYSGLEPCASCQGQKISAYDCRLGHGHNEDLPNTYLSTLYRKCHDSGPKFCAPGRGKGKKIVGTTWFCTRCNDENKDANKRCTLCQKWRDGKRTNNLIWPRDKNNKKKKQPPKTVKMWECSRCNCWNSFLKCDCTGCGQQGGTVIFVPTSEVEEMKVKDTSMAKSGPRWTCPHCHHINKQSRSYCENCTQAKKEGAKATRKKAKKDVPKDPPREAAASSPPPPAAAIQAPQPTPATAPVGALARPPAPVGLLQNSARDALELKLANDRVRLREVIAVEQQLLARQLLGGGIGSLLGGPSLPGATGLLGLGGLGAAAAAGGHARLGGLGAGLDPFAAPVVTGTWACLHCRNQNLDQLRTCLGCGQLRIEGGSGSSVGIQALSNVVQEALAKYGQQQAEKR